MGRVLFGSGASLVTQRVKNLPKMQKTWVQSLHREDLLEKEMAAHPSILADRRACRATVHGVRSQRVRQA